MSKKHDENKDLYLISKIAKIDYAFKTIEASKSAIIGIRTLGRIDYLVNYCGWFFRWNNAININRRQISDDNSKTNKREAKKRAKENTLTDKTKKRKK